MALGGLIVAMGFCILLESPDGPESYIGEVNAVDAAVELAGVHEVAQGFGGRAHDLLVVVAVVDGDGRAGRSHEGVAGAYLAQGYDEMINIPSLSLR